MRILFAFFLFALTLNANILLEKIENLIGPQSYTSHKNLITVVFENQEKFYLADGTPDYITIFKELKNNGLLNLKLPSPKDIEVEFQTTHSSVKSLKVLNDTLKSIGYYYYFTKSIKRVSQDELTWIISLQSEFIIDPLVLISELSKNNSKVLEIKREENDKWIYKIDTNFATIAESIFININEIKKLQKPLKPYLLKIDSGDILEVKSNQLDNWFVYVTFFDDSLNVLNVVKNEESSKEISLEIPLGTKYIKISDLNTLENIKRGLEIIIKNKEDNNVPRN